jgi:hypothetical protein
MKLTHRDKMKARRLRQHARRGRPTMNSPKVKYSGTWLRAIRALKGIGRPL